MSKKNERQRRRRNKRINPPALDYPYRRAEPLAGLLGWSTGTFYRYVKMYDIPKHRRGNGRGFVWFIYEEVRAALEKAGIENLPPDDLDLDMLQGGR